MYSAVKTHQHRTYMAHHSGPILSQWLKDEGIRCLILRVLDHHISHPD
jgi:hypothetical protein